MMDLDVSRKSFIILCIATLLIFSISMVMLELVSLPLCVLLGGAAAEVGRRIIGEIKSVKAPLKMSLISQILYSNGTNEMNLSSSSTMTNIQLNNEEAQPQPPDELHITSEIDQYLRIIMKEYILSWYNNVSTNTQFPNEIEYGLEDLLVALTSRIRQFNSRVFATKVLLEYHKYFQSFVRARHQAKITNTSVEDVFEGRHYSLVSDKTEKEHLFNIVNVLLELTVPADILCCPVGRRLVVSLLVHQVLIPFVNYISHPLFASRCILSLLNYNLDATIDLKSDSPVTFFSTIDSLSLCDVEPVSSYELNVPNNTHSDLVIEKGIWQRLADDLPISSICKNEGEKETSEQKQTFKFPISNSLDKISDLFSVGLSFSGISNNLANYFQLTTDVDDCNQGSKNTQETVHEKEDALTVPLPSKEDVLKLDFNVTAGLSDLLAVTTGPVISDKLPIVCKVNNEKDILKVEQEALAASANDEEGSEQAQLTSTSTSGNEDDSFAYQENPFVKLNILSTEIVEGQRLGSHYAVYCIQYDAWFPDADSIKTVEMESYIDVLEPKYVLQSIMVKRRFREVVTLHARLEEEMKNFSFFKSIKGPNKWSIIPFNKLDKETIETRRRFLENYLQVLLSYNEITKTKCLRVFLAYGSDANVTFVRKPADIGQFVPRFDKILMKKMTGVLDKLKTALPSLPTEPFSSSTTNCLQTPSPVETSLKVSDRFFGYFNIGSLGSQDGSSSLSFDFGTEEETIVSLENRISRYLVSYDPNPDKIELALDAAEMDQWTQELWSPLNSSTTVNELKANVLVSEEENKTSHDDDPDIAEIVLSLLAEIFACDTMFNRDNLVHTLKITLGGVINSYINEVIDYCTCEAAFVKYLQSIRENLWSTESLVNAPHKDISHYEMARQALNNFIPNILVVILGKKNVDDNIDKFLGSFQSPKLTRHLIYCLIDVIIDEMLVKSRSQSILEKLGSST